ncbi:DNRLRE domain-containing protein [Micromonospora sp. NPDC003197]
MSLGRGVEQVSLGWRGELPQPVLDGPKATYVEVRPGVDLVIEAGRTGFEYFFVVKTPEAAAGLASVSMPWDTGSLEPVVVAGSPAAALRSTAGLPPVVVSEARMWDARVSPTTGEPVHAADVQVATETNQSGGTDLVLTPDPAFYTDPELTYPVTIDPKVNLNPAFDGYVQNTITVDDKSGEKDLRLGFSDDASEGCGSGCKARSFLSFHGMEAYRGASVVSAELFLWNFHSWSCTATEWQAWTTSYVNHTARWGSQPTWRALDGISTGTKGYGSCGDGWVSVSVKKTFQGAFSSTDSTANVGLQATSESNHNGWKKFNSFEAASNRPYVTLVYNRTPNVPTDLQVDSCYSACASPAVVRSGTPKLRAKVSDPDAGVLRTEYEVFDNAKARQVAKSGTAVTGVPSGSSTQPWWTVVPLAGAALPDGTYHWRARACDSYVCGGYSGWFTFTVDTQDVSLPMVTATPYAEKSTGTWNGGPGSRCYQHGGVHVQPQRRQLCDSAGRAGAG